MLKHSLDIKQNIRLMEQVGLPVLDPKAKTTGKLPIWMIVLIFRVMQNIPFTRDVMLGNHALSSKPEAMQLNEEFHKMMHKES